MGPLVDIAHGGKEEGRHDPVGKHLKDRPIEPLRRNGGQPQPDDAHMGDTGVADHVFEIFLGEPHQDPIDDTDGGQYGHEPRPVLPPFGAEGNGHAQYAEGA